jgi:hypothetical protein
MEDLIGEAMEGKPLPPKKPGRQKERSGSGTVERGASAGGKARAEALFGP